MSCGSDKFRGFGFALCRVFATPTATTSRLHQSLGNVLDKNSECRHVLGSSSPLKKGSQKKVRVEGSIRLRERKPCPARQKKKREKTSGMDFVTKAPRGHGRPYPPVTQTANLLPGLVSRLLYCHHGPSSSTRPSPEGITSLLARCQCHLPVHPSVAIALHPPRIHKAD